MSKVTVSDTALPQALQLGHHIPYEQLTHVGQHAHCFSGQCVDKNVGRQFPLHKEELEPSFYLATIVMGNPFIQGPSLLDHDLEENPMPHSNNNSQNCQLPQHRQEEDP